MGGIGFRAGTCYYTSEYLSYQIVAHTSFAYASLHVFVFLLVMCSYTASLFVFGGDVVLFVHFCCVVVQISSSF
jgi:hypothetical protein